VNFGFCDGAHALGHAESGHTRTTTERYIAFSVAKTKSDAEKSGSLRSKKRKSEATSVVTWSEMKLAESSDDCFSEVVRCVSDAYRLVSESQSGCEVKYIYSFKENPNIPSGVRNSHAKIVTQQILHVEQWRKNSSSWLRYLASKAPRS
jgi:hypothetical protein